jgi:hypothetical protein
MEHDQESFGSLPSGGAPAAPSADSRSLPAVGWISVEERMPEPDTECLVYGRSPWAKEPYVRIDTWSMQRECPVGWSSHTIETGYAWDDSDFDDITHWMPLPAAPSGGAGNAAEYSEQPTKDSAEASEPNQPEQQAEGRS